jgi:thymidylate synthase (FAD)
MNPNQMNKVELLGYYGSDLVHAQSAWTSTSRDITDEKKARVGKLLKMLASEGHHTPFEKSSLHFLVTVDQATHIHLLKHRIGVSINGESARYKELKEDKFYIPSDWSNAGDGGLIGQDWQLLLEEYTQQGNKLYHQCLEELTPLLGRKRAKESARFFKTFNSQITMDVMFNWRSFYHFQQLRNSEHAQVEVRQLAQDMLDLVKQIEGNPFKETIEAFNL